MRLIVLRHGKAEPRSESGADSDRKLVEQGIRQAEYVAGKLRDAGLVPDRILTSPVHRALQTARIVQQRMASAGMECPIELAAALPPDRAASMAVAIGNRLTERLGDMEIDEPTDDAMVSDLAPLLAALRRPRAQRQPI